MTTKADAASTSARNNERDKAAEVQATKIVSKSLPDRESSPEELRRHAKTVMLGFRRVNRGLQKENPEMIKGEEEQEKARARFAEKKEEDETSECEHEAISEQARVDCA